MDNKTSFPFSMIEKMMPMFPQIAVMGWMIVLIAFLVGLFVLSPSQTAFFSDGKAVREAALIGSSFVQANVTSRVTETWVPQFKFVGLGLGLMAITMALGTIAQNLRKMGMVITNHMPEKLRPDLPAKPSTVKIFQMSALMGIMILLAALIIGIILAVGPVPEYWNHSILGDLNPAAAGSALLSQLGLVSSFSAWLNPLRMLGMAFLFTAITLALKVIIETLKLQSGMLSKFYQQASNQ